MEQNRLRQKDGPTDGEAVFANSWMCIFGGCFGFLDFWIFGFLDFWIFGFFDKIGLDKNNIFS
jgi:hypothetical protein